MARYAAVPRAALLAILLVFLAAGFLFLFSRFWHLMVLDYRDHFEGWGVVQSFSMFLGHAFPMTETNGIKFEFNLVQILVGLWESFLMLHCGSFLLEAEEQEFQFLICVCVAFRSRSGGPQRSPPGDRL